jgi:transposase InsO family protein
LKEAGVEPSVGSVGDSYDNALAESVIGLYKTEVIHHRGPGVSSTMSSTPHSIGLIGSITAGCSNRLAMCRRRSSNRCIIAN